ncbi:Ion channel [Dictyocaulus viviparus]|uniref:Ion channel n=1 Tax=Dictyocaulus viviparus TaxID=29172 RepID=A0A0D8XZK8_DICVI|nr:Ion channel [Dictyocaulus viviparus]
MIFSLFGIPLMLLVLQDIGKLLTISMKLPWFQTKRIIRRISRSIILPYIFRFCTNQSLREIREIEMHMREDLEIFDLPVVVGVCLIAGWILLCSMVLSVWDQKWTLLESFYFFFISLSTIGLGDLVPSSPRLLVTMFGFILVGLSLVSMVINLLQTKMKKTYEAGPIIQDGIIMRATIDLISPISEKHICCEAHDYQVLKSNVSRSTQTNLSLPAIRQIVLRSDGVHWVTNESPLKSPDEVTRLVELETSLRVCEQIGDNNEDDEDNESLLMDETNVLVEIEEDSNK